MKLYKSVFLLALCYDLNWSLVSSSFITTEVVNAHVLIITFEKLLFMQEFKEFNKECGITIMTHVQPVCPQSTV